MLTDKDRCQIPVGETGKCAHSRKVRITHPGQRISAIYTCYPHMMMYVKDTGGELLIEVLRKEETYDSRRA